PRRANRLQGGVQCLAVLVELEPGAIRQRDRLGHDPTVVVAAGAQVEPRRHSGFAREGGGAGRFPAPPAASVARVAAGWGDRTDRVGGPDEVHISLDNRHYRTIAVRDDEQGGTGRNRDEQSAAAA